MLKENQKQIHQRKTNRPRKRQMKTFLGAMSLSRGVGQWIQTHTHTDTQRQVLHNHLLPCRQISGKSPGKSASKILSAASRKCILDQDPSQHGEHTSLFPSTHLPITIHPLSSLSPGTGLDTNFCKHFGFYLDTSCSAVLSSELSSWARFLEVENPEWEVGLTATTLTVLYPKPSYLRSCFIFRLPEANL